ncbi:hypothetical protein PPL_05820 [Heterostelium album PN500]|uniref:Uncharacterized protein n=1 Tax=Heterostelium pallidum (strain ATCC 26659 / Pp 5 / PN500) TaxID=670386 RepID=D3BBF3_HETP5|nr:hypothetical protein PPL_05820 [Heterostelium album PN500]EFA80986.1 hypothetical protein PPL_05820 [Heterostelium album PN500]|eukprot:XP_020433104.1 hypothetical protein PPL_05820 [Heterostelium album PN500]
MPITKLNFTIAYSISQGVTVDCFAITRKFKSDWNQSFQLRATTLYCCSSTRNYYGVPVGGLDCNWCSGFWKKLVGVNCIILANNLLITIGFVLLFLISLLLFEIRSSAANIVSARDIKLFIVCCLFVKTMSNLEERIKLLIIGRSHSGKRSIAMRFYNDYWTDDPGWNGKSSFYSKKIKLLNYDLEDEDEDQKQQQQLQQEFEVLMYMFIRLSPYYGFSFFELSNLDGVMMMYNPTQPDTIDMMIDLYERLIRDLEYHRSNNSNNDNNNNSSNDSNNKLKRVIPNNDLIIFFVVATFSDLINKNNHQSVVENYNRVEQWRLKTGIKQHIITSAKENLNAKTLFYNMALEVINIKSNKKLLINKTKPPTNQILITNEKVSTSYCNII